MEDKYNSYFNAFLNAALKKLKSGFGTVVTFYPYTEGTVLKVEMKKGYAHNKLKKSISASLGDSLAKTALFDKNSCSALEGKEVTDTIVVVASVNEYVIIKNNSNEASWSDASAEQDFLNIVTKVKEKYGNS